MNSVECGILFLVLVLVLGEGNGGVYFGVGWLVVDCVLRCDACTGSLCTEKVDLRGLLNNRRIIEVLLRSM